MGTTYISFLEMVTKSAETYGDAIYRPPANLPASAATSHGASPVPGGPSINLRAGGYELNVGGAGGTGLFRSTDSSANVQLGGQIAQVGDGIREGAGRLWGNVRQRMEERASRSNTPPR